MFVLCVGGGLSGLMGLFYIMSYNIKNGLSLHTLRSLYSSLFYSSPSPELA